MENKKDKKGILLKVFSIILKLLYYLVISFVCLIAIFLIYYIISSQFHNGDENYKPKISIYTIVSPSMTPVIEVYDVVVNVRADTPKDIQIGDIITYKSTAPTSEGMTITHRVIAIEQLPDGTYEYMTQGDNNSEPDSTYVLFDNVIGKEIITIPKVGYIQFLLASKKGWLFLLLIPIGIYLLREVFKLIDLLGLRNKVDKVVKQPEKPKEEKLSKEKQEQLKVEIKDNLLTTEAKKDSYTRSIYETDGFLEKYKETIVKVKTNKYQKDKTTKEEVKTEVSKDISVIAPTKVTADNIEEQPKKNKAIELPKVKQKPLVVNEHYEILDTDELSSKIKEYDSKIEQLDKMIKDIENIKPEEVKEPEEITEIDDFLQGSKIKVTKIEETKNKRNKKVTSKKESSLVQDIKPKNLNIAINILPQKEEPKKEEKKTTPKKQKELNLNPKEVKKINRKPKKETSKDEKKKTKLNLNPKDVKKVNRPGKKRVTEQPKRVVEQPKTQTKKDKLIVIEKKK